MAESYQKYVYNPLIAMGFVPLPILRLLSSTLSQPVRNSSRLAFGFVLVSILSIGASATAAMVKRTVL